MKLSIDLRNVESIFAEDALRAEEGYWFSYRNSRNAIAHFFHDKIVIYSDCTICIPFETIEGVSISVPDIRFASMCTINISRKVGKDVSFSVDTVSQGKFFDIFPIQKALARRIALNKRGIDSNDKATH